MSLERLTYLHGGKWRMRIGDTEYSGKEANRVSVYEDLLDGYDIERLRELVEADRSGRCVVLPFPMHKMLFDMSDPIRLEILKDFRISATWDHCGIVFHSPWNIFLENVEKGHIRIIHESVEAIPGEEGDGCEADSV